MNMRDALLCYLVLDPAACADREPLTVAALALAGGVTCLQLRAKGGSDDAWLALATALTALARRHGVPCLINDRVELARRCGADGVHLGPRDLPPAEARRILGPSARIGYSPPSLEADPGPVDYVGLGPVFATSTKLDAKAPLGVAGLTRWRHAFAALPAVAIGGLEATRIAGLADTGVDGVAVVSAICGAPDPQAAAVACRDAVATWAAA
jgi:thiamine-phosphate diphosphorylase